MSKDVGDEEGPRDPNYLFYCNRLPMSPTKILVDDIHAKWCIFLVVINCAWRKVTLTLWKLITVGSHSFTQWLFPVFEGTGVNYFAAPLSKEGARLMRNDLAIAHRIIKSYRMMLHFYGMELLDERTGEVGRHPDPIISKWQLQNLNCSGHNYLRISRIITSLGELGFMSYRKPLVDHLAAEMEAGLLPNCRQSLEDFWRRLLDPSTPWYEEKTLEEPADREPSIFFVQQPNTISITSPSTSTTTSNTPPSSNPHNLHTTRTQTKPRSDSQTQMHISPDTTSTVTDHKRAPKTAHARLMRKPSKKKKFTLKFVVRPQSNPCTDNP
ncbi:opioid growth factor receptor region [Pelomyxa schiedti]|nr:opioid growth factor receptor region [Pelomyxa schiedti]